MSGAENQVAGIAYSTASDIMQLRKLLNDQYADSSIFRELYQNADDAGANWVLVRYIEQGPGGHPLLDGPGVLVINDGYFKEENDEAIRRLGAGTKAQDAAAIGKFGFGLKSVFHWCEAFFYLASPNQEGGNGATFCRLFSPWGDRRLEWRTQTKRFDTCLKPLVDKAIRDAMPSLEIAADTRWFALYIPLRRPEQWTSAGGDATRSPIVGNQPTPDTLFPKSLGGDTAELLPLLRSVQRIRFHVPSTGFTAALTPDSTRTLGPEVLKADPASARQGRTFAGAVTLAWDGTGAQESRRYLGAERALPADHGVYGDFRAKNEWPRAMGFDPVTEREIDGKEKGEPHGAVFFLWSPPSPHGPAGLSVREAVFLPLEGAKTAAFDAARVGALLHGYYFVDAGRRALHHAERGDIQTKWNATIRREITLPLVLPALARFVEESGLGEGPAAERLTDGLAQLLPTDPEDRRALLREFQWLPALTDDPTPRTAYRLAPADAPFFALPSPEEEGHSAYPYMLFPGLREWAREQPLVFSNAPRLTEREPADWSAAQGAFATCDVAVAYADSRSETLRRYLKTLLRVVGPSLSAATWASILRSFSAAQEASLREWTFGDRSSQNIADDLNSILWELSPEQRETLSPAIRDIPLFRVSDHSQHRADNPAEPLTRLMSWAELERAHRSGLLFAREGREHASDLQKALAAGMVLRVHQSTVLSLLFGIGHGVDNCNDKTCIEALMQKKPPLAPPASRLPLLKRLLLVPETHIVRERKVVLRYLLHGNQEHFSNTDTSLLAATEASNAGDDVWGRIARALSGGLDRWRVVDRSLVTPLNPEQKRRLAVDALGPEWVEKELRAKQREMTEAEFASFVARLPWKPEQDAVTVLGSLTNRDVFRAVPLHETVDGRYVALPPGTAYIQGDYPVPPALTPALTLIRNPRSSALRDQYTKHGVSHFAARHVLDLALDQAEPHRFCREILDALDALCPGGRITPGTLDEERRSKLRTVPWLPRRGASSGDTGATAAIAPKDVIHLPSAADALARLMTSPAVNGAYATPGMLAANVREHPALAVLEQCGFADEAQAEELLTLCVAAWAEEEGAGLRGVLAEDATSRALEEFLETFRDLPEATAPALPLLRALCGDGSNGVGAETTLRIAREALFGPPVADAAVVQMLHHLTKGGGFTAVGAGRQRARPAYFDLLRLLCERHGTRGALRLAPPLPNALGEWRAPESLCRNIPNAPDEWLLHDDCQDVLYGKPGAAQQDTGGEETPGRAAPSPPVTPPLSDSLPGPAQSSEWLDESAHAFVKQWREAVPQEVVGAFLAVLAVTEEAKRIADACLGHPGDADALRERLGLQGQITSTPFAVRVAPRERGISAENLLGEWVTLPARAELNGFLLEYPRYNSTIDRRVVLLCDHSPTADRTRNLALWDRTIADLVRFFKGKTAQWDEEWERLSQPEQTDLEMTQAMLLDCLFPYLKQGLQSGLTILRPYQERAGEIRRREFEAERLADDAAREAAERVLREERRRLRHDLRALLESNETAQAELLAAVRQKMEQFEYRLDSIPFELFQNADDAAVEWEEMGGSATDATLYVVETETGLRCSHRGRPINVFRRGDFAAEEGRRRGFDRDLEKMLVLQMSDKNERGAGQEGAAPTVTGKFGLGFKSVFLYADRVRVASGDLRFIIRGGMFPAAAGDEDAPESGLPRVTGEGIAPPTVLELERRRDLPEQDVPRVLGRFRALAPILTVFARRIQRCQLGEEEAVVSWAPRPVPGTTRAFVGCVAMPGEPRALFLKASQGESGSGNENTGILLALGAHGFQALPRTVPLFWVTAPTRDGTVAGYAVNGGFAVDVGRAQLAADSEENRTEAERLGHALGHAFVELAEALEGAGDAAREVLGLARDVPVSLVWESLWSLFSQPLENVSPTADALLRSIFWTQGRGYYRLLTERETLPTGLPGEKYGALTRLGRVRYCVSGIADDPERFAEISAWPGVAEAFPPGAVVSDARLASLLRLRGVTLPGTAAHASDSADLRLRSILEAIIGDASVSPERAARFGQVVTRDLLQKAESSEATNLWNYLTGLRFLSESGAEGTANNLLLPAGALPPGRDSKDAEEEAARAAFAPSQHRAAPEYCQNEAAVAFLWVCRGERQVRVDRSPADLAAWGRAASDLERQAAFLRYLATGEMAERVAQALRESGDGLAGTWLEDVTESDAFKTLDTGAQAQVLLRLRPAESVAALFASPPQAAPPEAEAVGGAGEAMPVPPATPTELERIYEEWMSAPEANQRAYDNDTYPDGGAFFAHLVEEPQSQQEREAWVTLLLRGSLETVGMSGGGQRREFLRLCQDEGWIERFAARRERGEELSSLFKPFDTWIEDQIHKDSIPHFHNLRYSLPTLFMMRWLDEYAGAFHRMNRVDMFHMQHFLTPYQSKVAADAPPLRPYLGIGAHFVLRELVRKGILRNPAVVTQAAKYCYVPSRSVREFLDVAEVGTRADQARAIYDALCEALGEERATFGGAFDLPLLRHLKNNKNNQSAARTGSHTGWVTINGRPVYIG